MGVGAGVGFAGEPEACWPGAVPPLKTKARIVKRIRITGWMIISQVYPSLFRWAGNSCSPQIGSTAPSEPVAPPAIWGRANVLTEIARFRPARKEADAYRLYRPKVPYNPAPFQANSARIVPAAAATPTVSCSANTAAGFTVLHASSRSWKDR